MFINVVINNVLCLGYLNLLRIQNEIEDYFQIHIIVNDNVCAENVQVHWLNKLHLRACCVTAGQGGSGQRGTNDYYILAKNVDMTGRPVCDYVAGTTTPTVPPPRHSGTCTLY